MRKFSIFLLGILFTACSTENQRLEKDTLAETSFTDKTVEMIESPDFQNINFEMINGILDIENLSLNIYEIPLINNLTNETKTTLGYNWLIDIIDNNTKVGSIEVVHNEAAIGDYEYYINYIDLSDFDHHNNTGSVSFTDLNLGLKYSTFYIVNDIIQEIVDTEISVNDFTPNNMILNNSENYYTFDENYLNDGKSSIYKLCDSNGNHNISFFECYQCGRDAINSDGFSSFMADFFPGYVYGSLSAACLYISATYYIQPFDAIDLE
ncbi:hypothetical protein [Myroides indicus]|uniref:Uncharacterized protein n=1 Tax=Myroides indicus TaxID=1323422 RepID=A0A4R7ELW9_9FLAO|nr:hypothetical protein [Myroides indicus]TDS50713.1 hypothetical protein C8P70_1524 [Myroides indicus]